MKQVPFHFIILFSLPIGGGCSYKQQPINGLILGKWQMVKYAGGCVNALDTITFYENGKMDYPFETGEFTYRFITS